MTINSTEITKQKIYVQQLENQVHSAKVKLDHMLLGPGGLPTDPEALSRCMASLRKARGPGSVPKAISDAYLPDLNYRKLRAQWILAKAELDSMLSSQQVPGRVNMARKTMKEKFQNDITTKINDVLVSGREFVLSQDPALQKRVEEAVNEAVLLAKTEKTLGAVTALTETIGTAQILGLGDTKCDQAIKSAALVAKNIAIEARKQSRANPNSKVLQKAAIRAEALSLALGNETVEPDFTQGV